MFAWSGQGRSLCFAFFGEKAVNRVVFEVCERLLGIHQPLVFVPANRSAWRKTRRNPFLRQNSLSPIGGLRTKIFALSHPHPCFSFPTPSFPSKKLQYLNNQTNKLPRFSPARNQRLATKHPQSANPIPRQNH